MFYGSTPQETRQVFFDVWDKHLKKQAMSPLEQQVLLVILDHPEYHSIMQSPERHAVQSYFPELGETNPFLHMGLHLALREQITTDRPLGIQSIFHTLTQQQNVLDAEHSLMNCLAEALWQAARNQSIPDESYYLESCKKLIK